ncbi:MAG: glycoside hydrolase family 3 C-terminal domain-containing protein, partial [Acidimicrobiales bacterium]
IVVVGLDQDSETEGEDRASLSLPGDQDDLVRAVTAANPRTVVLVNAGAPVDLSSAIAAPGLAQVWYLGQESGDAVAGLLVGDAAPSGRLPTTFGARLDDWPSHATYPGTDGHVAYGDEGLVGYRGFDALGIDPVFCFGHGLTYTTFEWSDGRSAVAEISRQALEDGAVVSVGVTVTNVGDRAAADVVQCYVRPARPEPGRPPRRLATFAKVRLDPAESTEVHLELDHRSFATWDLSTSTWTVADGAHTIDVGASSRDLRSSVTIEIT